MAKFIFRTNRDGEIYAVQSFSRYKERYTEEELLQQVEEFNRNVGEDDYLRPYEVAEVDKTTSEIIDFLLGEDKYQSQKDIRDICGRLDDTKNKALDVIGILEELRNDYYELQNELDNIKENIESKLEDED